MAFPECCDKPMTGLEYAYDSLYHYDGVSEWVCEVCGKRIGRWTKRILGPDEHEPRYGV